MALIKPLTELSRDAASKACFSFFANQRLTEMDIRTLPSQISLLEEEEKSYVSVRGRFNGIHDPKLKVPRTLRCNIPPLSHFSCSKFSSFDGENVCVQVNHPLFPEFWLTLTIPLNENSFKKGAKLKAIGRVSSGSVRRGRLEFPPYLKPYAGSLQPNELATSFVQEYYPDERVAIVRIEDYDRDPGFWLEIRIERDRLEAWLDYEEKALIETEA